MTVGRRLLVAGGVLLLGAVAAFVAPVHAGDADCGSVVAPGTDAATTDCRDYQRVLLLGGVPAFAAGLGLAAAGWHLDRRREPEEEDDVEVSDVYLELYGRLPDLVAGAVGGLTGEQLASAPAPGANTVGWLVWHLARVQDHHVAELLGEPQVYESGDWAARFGLAADPSDTGYGHSPEEVLGVRPDGPEACTSYHAAVHERTVALLRALTSADLDRIVDRRWDPPVTLGVRLVSIADDGLQHAGQAAYARGVLLRDN